MAETENKSTFPNVDEKNLHKVLCFINGLVSVSFLVGALLGLAWKDYALAVVSALGIVLQIIPFWLNRSGRLRASALTQIFIASGVIGAVAAMGQGIRDVVTTAFPIIIFFASMTLSNAVVILAIMMTLLMALLLVVGQSAGWFTLQPYTQEVGWLQFGVISVILIAAGLAASVFLSVVRGTKLRLFQEIAEKEKNAETLRQSEARYRLISENSADVIWTVDVGTRRTTYVSPSVFKLRGFTQEEMTGRSLEETLTPASYRFVSEGLPGRIKAFEAGNSSMRVMTSEVDQPHKDGSVVHVEVITTLLTDASGKVTSILGMSRDLTERVRAQEERRRMEEKAEITSRLASIGEMASGIAHEINNPLASVIGFSELLLERQDLPPDVARTVRIIYNGSDRVKGIVKRMLTFARQSKPQQSRVDIVELIDNTLELRQYSLKTSNIEVVREFSADLPWMTADAAQLQQVFLNLIINAEYAIKKARDRGVLVIRAHKIGDLVRVSFKDNGVGMTEDTTSRLFQSFFTTKETGEGTGLGLSLSLGIIREHGGIIRAEGEIGKGSTFTIELPFVQSELPPSDAPVPPADFKTDRAVRMLVVDDEPSMRQLIKSILTGKGYLAEESLTPYDALNRIEKTFYDVIFIDIRMPGMSGRELYDEVAARYPKEAERVIAITGDTADQSNFEFFKTRKVPVLTKPLDRDLLFSMINKILMRESA